MENKAVEWLAGMTASSTEVTPDILVLQFTIVNACLVGDPGTGQGEFVLVDTGLENSAEFIIKAVEERFGKGRRPQAVVLTHGHFDHVGSVVKLARLWDVPVYAHELELPYLTGQRDYPLADSGVSSGLVAKMSPSFPHTSIDIGDRIVALPEDGRVPGMPAWRWVHTPGHTPGHVSFFRERDGVLIAGDALSTTKQESLFSVLTQREQISGPPAYLTTDWQAAEESVERLRDLRPSLIIASHGKPMGGKQVEPHLEFLVNQFDHVAKPERGRFLHPGR